MLEIVDESAGFGQDGRLVYIEFLEALCAVAVYKSPGERLR